MSQQFYKISGTPALTGSPVPAVGAVNMAIIKTILKDFKKLYCELSGVNSFSKLNTTGKVE